MESRNLALKLRNIIGKVRKDEGSVYQILDKKRYPGNSLMKYGFPGRVFMKSAICEKNKRESL